MTHLIDFQWASYNITNLSTRPMGYAPELWDKLKAIRRRIDAGELPKPTEHRGLIFGWNGEYWGIWPAGRTYLPKSPEKVREYQEQPLWKDSR